jgi:transposase
MSALSWWSQPIDATLYLKEEMECIRRQLKRRYVLAFFEKLSPCLVGIEACASSHH